MILFKKLRYKNFLSTGDNWNELDFLKNKTTLVVGHNGSGKSTMLDALSFALFGRAHRNIKKDQLVNSINKKGAKVEVEFKVNGSDFKIVRAILSNRPNVFEIWKDGIMINQDSHSKEYQKILEQNIIKMNHKSFHQIVVLGSSSFVPFMQLNSNHRREVIEELLDIGVFSKMNMLLREKNALLKDKIRENEYQADLLEERVKASKDNIAKIKLIGEEQKQVKEKQISHWQNEIEALDQENKILRKAIDDIAEATKEAHRGKMQEKSDIEKSKAQFNTELKAIKKTCKFYETNDTCPTCDQDIDILVKEDKVASAHARQEELLEAVNKADEAMINTLAELDKAKEKIMLINNNIKSIDRNNTTISNLNNNIATAKDEIDNIGKGAGDLSKANEQFHQLNKDRSSLEEDGLELSAQAAYNKVMSELLKDTGIKTKIIKQYLPVINQVVNQYLQTLDFFVSFELDESFQETIRSRHRDLFTYDSFSEGEKQRIDLALLFTWRMIAKMKNSVSTNLLLLDETFDSSLDDDGVDNLMKILYTFDDDTNVFVISHKGELLEGKFDSKIEFFKHKNFSKMK